MSLLLCVPMHGKELSVANLMVAHWSPIGPKPQTCSFNFITVKRLCVGKLVLYYISCKKENARVYAIREVGWGSLFVHYLSLSPSLSGCKEYLVSYTLMELHISSVGFSGGSGDVKVMAEWRQSSHNGLCNFFPKYAASLVGTVGLVTQNPLVKSIKLL